MKVKKITVLQCTDQEVFRITLFVLFFFRHIVTKTAYANTSPDTHAAHTSRRRLSDGTQASSYGHNNTIVQLVP